MSWNFRVAKRLHEGAEEAEFGIVEAHYHNKEDTVPHSWSGFIPIIGESRSGLLWQVEKIMEAFEKPVLDLNELENT